MPSGITSDIYEGKDVSLRDYLMTVGRQMGYAILQRDDALDRPVTKVEPDTRYHDEALEKARASLAEAEGWSAEQAEYEASQDYDRAYRAWCDRVNRDSTLRSRYEDMIEQVEAWQPDRLVASTKTYALKYLRESIKFDCPEGGRWNAEPEFVAGPEFREQRIAKAKHDIAYHTAERIKELARADERNRYIAAFLGSLPAESTVA